MLWKPGSPPIGLYIHVPFCRSICTYCAFAKGEYDAAAADRWLEILANEIAFRGRETWSGKPVLDTVFLGGGTPSTLSAVQWQRLGATLSEAFVMNSATEFTSEANPESFTPEIAASMLAIGVNRVSLGVQSLDRAELDMLGRAHGVAEVGKAVSVARDAGFRNLNLDLMYALPGQTVDVFGRSLEGILELEPDHISAYCLGLEPGTSLAQDVAEGSRPEPEDETARDLYDHLVDRLDRAGLTLYEISNFARSGFTCRHNLRYWRREDVIGLGPSAHGFLAERRWVNPAPLEQWGQAYAGAASPPSAPPPRPVPDAMARFEWVFLRLRLVEGISKTEFEARWGDPFERAYRSTLTTLLEGGLLEDTGDRIRLTPSARFLSDAVFSEFAPA